MGIFLSEILAEIYSFTNMMKHNICKNNIIHGSPPKRATWEGKSQFLVKKGNKRRN